MLELPRDILDPTKIYGPLGELELLVRDLVSNDFSRYILFRPTYVRFQQDAEGHSVTQELCDYPKDHK